MSIWDKLAGAAASIGGPIGAVLTRLGHLAMDGPAHDKQVAFTVGVIMLGAKMAKADGVVTRDEVEAFKEVFKVPTGEQHNVARLFNLAKQDVAGYETYARQLRRLFHNNRELLSDVLDGLFHIAVADDKLHPGEDQFLARVAKEFGSRTRNIWPSRGGISGAACTTLTTSSPPRPRRQTPSLRACITGSSPRTIPTC